jgi:hypothetical protein
MGLFKRKSLVFLTTAFLLLILGEGFVYFKTLPSILCTILVGFKADSPDVLIGVFGILFGLFSVLHLGLRRTVFWGLLLGFLGNLFALINLWKEVSAWTYPNLGGSLPVCPPSPSFLIAYTLSFTLVAVCSWAVGLLAGVFLAYILKRTKKQQNRRKREK